ncbi:MAG: hypothetical protein ACE5DX_01940 [Candidatus Dojkabacteria bacterium]
MKRLKIIITLAVLVLALHGPVLALDRQIKLPSQPETASLEGAFHGDIDLFEIVFNTSSLPEEAILSTAVLNFKQSGSSNGVVTIINKADSNILDSKSLLLEGNKKLSGLETLVREWSNLEEGEENEGIIFQGTNIGDNDIVTFSDVEITVTYEIPDTDAPEIEELEVGFISTDSALVSWESNEKVKGMVRFGKTSEYSTFTQKSGRFKRKDDIAISGLSPGITYHLQLQLEDQSGNLTISQDTTFITSISKDQVLGAELATVPPDVISPPRILNLEVSAQESSRQVTVKWSKSKTDDIDGYIILRSKDSGGNYQEIQRTGRSDTDHTDFTVEGEHTYFYTVRAFRENEQSQYTDELAIFVPGDTTDAASTALTDESNAYPRSLVAIAAIVGLILGSIYLFWKIITRFWQKRLNTLHPKGLENVLRDPSFYSDEY